MAFRRTATDTRNIDWFWLMLDTTTTSHYRYGWSHCSSASIATVRWLYIKQLPL